VRWILEDSVVPELHARMHASAEALGHAVSVWSEDWPEQGWPAFGEAST